MQSVRYCPQWLFACLILISGLVPFQSQAQEVRENDEVIVTLLRIDKPEQAALCYTTRYDRASVRLPFAVEDTINSLGDFAYEEDPLPGPECFIPDLRFIYRSSTYVVSLYCTKVLRYKNSGPFTPSSQRIESDLVITEGLQAYFRRLKQLHFPDQPSNSALLEKISIGAPLGDEAEEAKALDWLLEDEWTPEDESDLEADSRPLLPEEEDPEDPKKPATKPKKKN